MIQDGEPPASTNPKELPVRFPQGEAILSSKQLQDEQQLHSRDAAQPSNMMMLPPKYQGRGPKQPFANNGRVLGVGGRGENKASAQWPNNSHKGKPKAMHNKNQLTLGL
jgi:hypothetical protein